MLAHSKIRKLTFDPIITLNRVCFKECLPIKSESACLEAVPLRQLRLKILARQHRHQLLQVQPSWDFNNSIIKFRVPMSLALSLCQYVLRSRRGLAEASPGLAQASPSLKAPRLQAFETRDLLHQHNRKGQVVMIKTRRSKRLVFRRSGGLPCSRPLLRTRCWLV